MAKILLFLGIALLVYLALRWRRMAGRRSGANPPDHPAPDVTVVACSRCGVHVPISESVEVAGQRYCCEEHSRLG